MKWANRDRDFLQFEQRLDIMAKDIEVMRAAERREWYKALERGMFEITDQLKRIANAIEEKKHG